MIETLMKDFPVPYASAFIPLTKKRQIPDYELDRSHNTWHREGTRLLKEGDYEEALKLFSEILERDRNDFYSWFCKGRSLLGLGRLEDALTNFDGAVRIKPDYVEAWAIKGWLLFLLEKYEEAVESFDQAIKLGNEFDKAAGWYYKGFALLGMNKFEEALASFENAFPIAENLEPILDEDPGNASLYQGLAVIIVFKGMDHIASANMEDAEKWAHDFNFLRRKAESIGMAQDLEDKMKEARDKLSGEELELLTEFEDMVRLGAIDDPLERREVLREMIRQKWPEGVSAVDAIREQRE